MVTLETVTVVLLQMKEPVLEKVVLVLIRVYGGACILKVMVKKMVVCACLHVYVCVQI